MARKRDLFGYIAVALATATATGVLWYALVLPTNLRVSVSPPGGESARLLQAVSGELERQRRPIRLLVVGQEDLMEPAAALDESRADLAVVRPDYRMPSSGLGVAILQQHYIFAVARRSAEITQFAELRGRRVGTLESARPGPTLVTAFRALEASPAGENGPQVFSNIDELVEAFGKGDIEGVVVVSRRGGPLPAMLMARLTERSNNEAPVILSMRGAASFAEGQGTFAAGEIAAGEIVRAPPLPAEAVPTLTFPSLLVTRARISENAIEELTRQLFTLRPALAAEHPLAGRIEALSTDRGSGIAVHPGAATYYDANERTFLDRYSDLLWIALFGFGGIASAGAFFVRLLFPRERELSRTDHVRFVELLAAARRAESLDGIADIERQVDEQIGLVSLQMLEGTLDREKKPAFDLIIDQLRLALQQRRAELHAAPPSPTDAAHGQPAFANWTAPPLASPEPAAADAAKSA